MSQYLTPKQRQELGRAFGDFFANLLLGLVASLVVSVTLAVLWWLGAEPNALKPFWMRDLDNAVMLACIVADPVSAIRISVTDSGTSRRYAGSRPSPLAVTCRSSACRFPTRHTPKMKIEKRRTLLMGLLQLFAQQITSMLITNRIGRTVHPPSSPVRNPSVFFPIHSTE